VRTLAQSLPETRRDTLEVQFDSRRNSVNALRLALAGLVLVSHTVQASTGDGDPVGRFTGSHVDLSTMAVDAFFALSGFLIAGSFLSSPSVGRYLWRRALRILPGFWVCLVASAALLAPLTWLLARHTLSGFPVTGPASATAYVWRNAGLLIREFHITGAFDGEAVNGSVHTLFYEFACYLMVAVVGVLGIMRTRPWLVVAMLAVAWLITLAEAVGQTGVVSGQPGRELMLRYGTVFLAGMVGQLYARRIRLTSRGGLLAVVTLAGALTAARLCTGDSRSTLTYSLLAPPAMAYLVLLVGCSPRLAHVGARRDLSYGLYVYAWPVQATLVVVGAHEWWLPVYLVVSLAVALGLAYLSWTYVESPALALKSWTPRSPVWHSHRKRSHALTDADGDRGPPSATREADPGRQTP
jgi:peptidoglycan/LPS O-acetylase OafA/YrhL